MGENRRASHTCGSTEQELAKPVLEAFWSWIETVNALHGGKLGKAVAYAVKSEAIS